MRQICLSLWVIVGALAAGAAMADGMMIPTEANWKQRLESSMVNEPDQKAVVFYSKGKEQLIISPSYSGQSSDFAWVVPVPSRPKVEIVKGALFHELMSLTAPPPPRYRGSKALDAMVASPAPQVTVIERKTVGAYDVSVLSANDAEALMKWLKANKYHLPPKAVDPVRSCVKSRWTFVACRIKAPAASKGLATGTLAPLKLTFSTKHPVYPMRLTAANPRPFRLLVYFIAPSEELGGHPRSVALSSAPGVGETNFAPKTEWAASLTHGQARYRTLSRLSNQELQVYVLRTGAAWFRPGWCTKDYVWKLPRKS